MKAKTKIFLKIAASTLIFLWVYAAVSKLTNFPLFKVQMYRQTIPHWLADVLIWTLPPGELALSALLLYDVSRMLGLKISAFLLSLFTVYILMVLLNVFGRIPCACGGIIQSLGWKLHLVFNLFFLLLSISAIYLTNRERRAPQ